MLNTNQGITIRYELILHHHRRTVSKMAKCLEHRKKKTASTPRKLTRTLPAGLWFVSALVVLRSMQPRKNKEEILKYSSLKLANSETKYNFV